MDKTILLSSVAHEIKNPLSVIKANVDIIKSYEGQNYSKNFMVIENEVNKLTQLLNKFMESAEVEEVHSIEKNEICINEIIEDIILENTATYPNVIFELLPCEDILLKAIEYDMHIVFSNIIKNGIDATKMSGKITIQLCINDGLLIVQIMDDGEGIAKVNEKRIFENLFTTKKTGNGIGLTIIKNIVFSYGGDFYLQNREEKGTIATVKIPVV